MWKKIIDTAKTVGQVAWAILAVGILIFIAYNIIKDVIRDHGSSDTPNAVLPAKGGALPGGAERHLKVVYGKVKRDSVSKLHLLPVLYRSVSKTDREEGRAFDFGSSKYSSGYGGDNESFGMEYSNFNNLILRDPLKGGQRLLLDKPGFITNFVVLQPDKGVKASKTVGYFFFSMAEADTNKDGVIDGADEIGAYVAKRDGSAYWKVSPKGLSYESWNVEPDSDVVYLELREDSNKDGKFEGDDSIHLYIALPPDFKKLGPAVDPALDQQLHKLMPTGN